MDKRTAGGKKPLHLWVTPELRAKLDEARGLIPMQRYVVSLLEQATESRPMSDRVLPPGRGGRISNPGSLVWEHEGWIFRLEREGDSWQWTARHNGEAYDFGRIPQEAGEAIKRLRRGNPDAHHMPPDWDEAPPPRVAAIFLENQPAGPVFDAGRGQWLLGDRPLATLTEEELDAVAGLEPSPEAAGLDRPWAPEWVPLRMALRKAHMGRGKITAEKVRDAVADLDYWASGWGLARHGRLFGETFGRPRGEGFVVGAYFRIVDIQRFCERDRAAHAGPVTEPAK